MFELEDVTEDTPVQDFYVAGLAGIEDAGGGALRFLFYKLQRSRMHKDRRQERVLVPVAIVMSPEEVNRAGRAAILAAAGMEGIIHGIPVDRRDGNGDLN